MSIDVQYAQKVSLPAVACLESSSLWPIEGTCTFHKSTCQGLSSLLWLQSFPNNDQASVFETKI